MKRKEDSNQVSMYWKCEFYMLVCIGVIGLACCYGLANFLSFSIQTKYFDIVNVYKMYTFRSIIMVKEKEIKLVFTVNNRQHWVVNDNLNVSTNAQCNIDSDNMRFDCYPGTVSSQTTCEARGCCWRVAQGTNTGPITGKVGRAINVPHCYFPKDYPSYSMSSPKSTATGYTATLTRSGKSPYPNDVMVLTFDVHFETSSRLHFKVNFKV